ncbi:hypothetical protein ACA910_015387 [Epithemia clementina (nom. ined.)]
MTTSTSSAVQLATPHDDEMQRSDSFATATLSARCKEEQPSKDGELVTSSAEAAEAAADAAAEAAVSAMELLERPKRPLSAYNLFFQDERQKLLATRPVRPEGVPLRRGHGKMGFAEMAKTIAAKWKVIDAATKAKFDELALEEKARYRHRVAEWKQATTVIKNKNNSKNRTQKPSKTKSSGAEERCNYSTMSEERPASMGPSPSLSSASSSVEPPAQESSSHPYATATGHSREESDQRYPNYGQPAPQVSSSSTRTARSDDSGRMNPPEYADDYYRYGGRYPSHRAFYQDYARAETSRPHHDPRQVPPTAGSSFHGSAPPAYHPAHSDSAGNCVYVGASLPAPSPLRRMTAPPPPPQAVRVHDSTSSSRKSEAGAGQPKKGAPQLSRLEHQRYYEPSAEVYYHHSLPPSTSSKIIIQEENREKSNNNMIYEYPTQYSEANEYLSRGYYYYSSSPPTYAPAPTEGYYSAPGSGASPANHNDYGPVQQPRSHLYGGAPSSVARPRRHQQEEQELPSTGATPISLTGAGQMDQESNMDYLVNLFHHQY